MAMTTTVRRMPSKTRKRANKAGKPTLSREEKERVKLAVQRLVDRFDGNGTALGKALGVSQATVSKWLDGISAPGMPMLDEIAKHLETTEFQIRKGAVADLETSLHYHGLGHWPAKAVRLARERANDMAAKGETMSPQSWSEHLNALAKQLRQE